jgi:hypothetical protein
VAPSSVVPPSFGGFGLPSGATPTSGVVVVMGPSLPASLSPPGAGGSLEEHPAKRAKATAVVAVA